eukprot:jgi/Ulvmu1/1504/UM011_0234.1
MHEDVPAALVATGCTRPHCLCPPWKLHRQDVHRAGTSMCQKPACTFQPATETHPQERTGHHACFRIGVQWLIMRAVATITGQVHRTTLTIIVSSSPSTGLASRLVSACVLANGWFAGCVCSFVWSVGPLSNVYVP